MDTNRIRRLGLGLLPGLSLGGMGTAASAADYAIDAAHSFVEFRIQHLGYSWLYGRFNRISGEGSHDPADPSANAIFESTKYTGDANRGTLEGMLTLHGVTKPIAIELEKLGEGSDPWGGYRAGFIGTVTLTRKDFGIGFNLGPASETMEFELGIEGIRK